MIQKIPFAIFSIVVSLFVFSATTAHAQTTAFTYQGRFTDSSAPQPTTGSYIMTFRLYDAASGGNQIPNNSTEITALLSLVNNIFTVRLNFGAAAFNTSGARYLEIQAGSTVLTPRQEITSAPFAMLATNAGNADSLGGTAANQFMQTSDARLSDARTPTAGSASYIQNTETRQPANFNISGDGTIGGRLTVFGNSIGQARIGDLFGNGNYTGISLNNSINPNDYNFLSSPTENTLYINRPEGNSIIFRKNNQTQMTLDNGGNLTVAGRISGDGSALTNLPVRLLPWETVTAATQAQPNRGYIAANDAAQVVITLPANPNAGDVVRVAGAGG